MRTHRDITITLALCGSLVVHAALIAALADEYVRGVGRVTLPALPGAAPTEVATAQPILVPVERAPYFDLGETTGRGDASDESPGEELMQSPKTAPRAQPLLSRDPIGFGKIGDEPTPSAAPTGEGGAVGAGAEPQPPSPAESAHDESPEPEREAVATAAAALPFGVGTIEEPTEAAQPRIARRPQPQAPSPSREAASANATKPGAPGRPGAPVPSADPAPQGESESDPFATVGGVEFRAGKTNVQFGRKHRITRPRINLAGIVDSLSLLNIDVVLQLRLDASGNVDRVRILKSSGSPSIDQACRLAAYEWWFEPMKDAAGKTTAGETFPFGIHFR